MACNYSSKFLPLIEYNKRAMTPEEFSAFVVNSFNDADYVFTILGMETPSAEKQDETKEVKRINTKQALIVKTGSNVESAYLGRSDAYSNMIREFRKQILEKARIKINFETGEVDSFNSNAVSYNNISRLNKSLFEYKLDLARKILKDHSEINSISELFNSVPDFNELDSKLTSLINYVGIITDVGEDAYDAYVVLTNFDKLLEQECPFIEIDKRYEGADAINKYKYIGSNVEHFTGWTSSEFTDSMNQATPLVRAILDYVPEFNEAGVPIKGSSIGLSGFYSTMTAMRNTFMYHADDSLLKLRRELRNGSKADMGKLIDGYLEYLQNPRFQASSISSFYDSHRTYLIGKLNGIKKCIFESNIDKELKDIFNNMFFKNVQMSYVGYAFDPMTGEFSGKDLKVQAINQQTYALSGAIASSIYNYKVNEKLRNSLIGNIPVNNVFPKYESKTNDFTGMIEIKYNGKFFKFEGDILETNFTLSEFKDIFFDLFSYIIPEDFETIGKQINGAGWSYKYDLSEVLKLGLQGIYGYNSKIKYEEVPNYPSNLNDWYKTFAQIGKIVSTIYGADTVNVVKNVDRKKNLPLFGLTSLAYNFPFVMWQHLDDDSYNNIYAGSFLFEEIETDIDGTEHIVRRSCVGEPRVRSEVVFNGKRKPSTQLTASEVTRLSVLNDFYQNYLNGDHIYLQNATFADKGTHFLVNYNLNTNIFNGKNLKQLIEEQMRASDPNKTGLFDLMWQTRSDRIDTLVNNILYDYRTVFPNETFETLEDITEVIKKKRLSHSDVIDAFQKAESGKGVNFYEEIHLSKGKVNETIALYYDIFSNRDKLAKRLNEERVKFINDLYSENFKLNKFTDEISKSLADTYPNWVDKTGEIILVKETTLHPVLEAYFMTNALLSNEYNEIMIGGVYAHSKNSEASRLIAQIKRSVIFGATMHSYAQGLENGVADEVKIACMPDIPGYVQSVAGDSRSVDSMDGSGLSTALQARLESNSLLDARTGPDKKTIGHDIDSRYGRPSLLKWAVYAMTNARRRIAFGSTVSMETLCRKAYAYDTIFVDAKELNEILGKLGSVYFKDAANTGNYYKILAFRENEGRIERALQIVDKNGTPVGKTSDFWTPSTLWDIDQIFGGAFAMKLNNDSVLDYSELNVDALEYYVTKHQDAKTKQIGYLVNKSAMKVGVGNMNKIDSWTDNSPLRTISMKTRYLGVQMDAEHDLDENEVTEMTQMISALSQNGYTAELVNNIYSDIGAVIEQALREYDDAIDSGNSKEIYKLLGEAFITSFENNDRDTLGLAQAFVLKASKALKEGNYDFRLPFSAETVNGIFISTISSMLTKKGIRRKYEGFAGVLTPSFNMIQYYNIGGKNMMFDQFSDLVIESGVKPLTDLEGNVIRSVMSRAINDVIIDGNLNPFLHPINIHDIDFEDTIVIFEQNELGQLVQVEDPIYINSFEQYDSVKHMDLSNKFVYNFTSRPKNLKGTNTKFRFNGELYSIYELDSVRAAIYAKKNPLNEYSNTILANNGYLEVDPNKTIGLLQKLVQRDLRNLDKGKPVMLNGFPVIATDVIVEPAQLITGRYHAKEFMLSSKDTMSTVLEKKQMFFIDKLRTKYDFTRDEPRWTERVLFSTDGERYLVKTVSEQERNKLMTSGEYPEDTTIQKIGNVWYKNNNRITSLEGISFHQYQNNYGDVWKVILVDSEQTKDKLGRSAFFEFYRNDYLDIEKQKIERKKFEERIGRMADRMYRSFMLQRQMLGTRIPTQGMGSFMPMEIVGYTDSEVNDIYVPTQMTYLQGSDFDIDKAYLLGYSINPSGQLFTNSKLGSTQGYSYEELFKLIPPTGISFTIVEDSDQYTFNIERNRLNTESWIDLFNEVSNSGYDQIKFDVIDDTAKEFVKQLNLHNMSELSDEQIDQSIKNQVVHNVLKVTSNVQNQLIAQISVDEATKSLKTSAEKSHLAEYEKTITSDNPMTMFKMQVQNMVGKEVIGITAVAMKQFFAKTAFYNQKIRDFIKAVQSNPVEVNAYVNRLLQLVVKTDPFTNRPTVFANLNFLDAIDELPNLPIQETMGVTSLHFLLQLLQTYADQNDGATVLNGILTLATDNAKELALSKLNATSKLSDIYTYCASLGINPQYVAEIMISPAFTYISKLADGDLFNTLSRDLSVDNALRFYLESKMPGISEEEVRVIGSEIKAKDLLNNSNELELAIQRCLAEISARKDSEKEMRAYMRNAIESGLDPEELLQQKAEAEEQRAEEVARLAEENGGISLSISDIKSVQLYSLIEYFKECIRRNSIKNNTSEETNTLINKILSQVRPGVEEQSKLGNLAGLNQGLKTQSYRKFSFEQNIENYITGKELSYWNSELWKAKKYVREVERDIKKNKAAVENLEKAQENVKRIEETIKNLIPFDLFSFIGNQEYHKEWISKMNELKVSDNILEIITTVPHYKEMFKTWYIDQQLLGRSSARYLLEEKLLKEIKPEVTYSFGELEFNQTKTFVNDILILNWLFSKNFKIEVPSNQQVYKPNGELGTVTKPNLELKSVYDIASFKRLMEVYIVPELKKLYPNNSFLKMLTTTSDLIKGDIKSYLKLPIPMMDIDKSVELEKKYNEYLNAFDDVASNSFAGMKIGDLFYLYNLIVNKDSFGQKSLTRLFENLVNSQKGTFLVNDYNDWISELDRTRDFTNIKYDSSDLQNRIKKYVPNTKIPGSVVKYKSDFTFEVSNTVGMEVPINKMIIEESETVVNRKGDINSILSKLLDLDYDDSYSGEDVLIDIESNSVVQMYSYDYTLPEIRNYFGENVDFIKNQKAFVYNGKVFLNMDNASVFDFIHEWAHVVLAKMKWSDKQDIRDKYYEILAQVTEHPKFNDIAEHYPWAHGSDLQEEVLANLFQMYMQNTVFKNDNIIKLIDTDTDDIKSILFDAFDIIDQKSLIKDKMFAEVFDRMDLDITEDIDEFILKKHQKISYLKDKMVKEEMLKLICK